ncbi:hypothetical protein VSU19_08725 [Verrucomicrobiales bacterium BCK34]|nr:hypothetical protein [Verrucomicrobiales bacterium BCK34]
MKKQITKKQNPITIFVLAATTVLFGFSTAVQADISQVRAVTASAQGQPKALYFQHGGKWMEIGLLADGSVRTFTETNRDEWSIFLADGEVTLQLDLHTKTVNYADSSQTIPNLYQVFAYHN